MIVSDVHFWGIQISFVDKSPVGFKSLCFDSMSAIQRTIQRTHFLTVSSELILTFLPTRVFNKY